MLSGNHRNRRETGTFKLCDKMMCNQPLNHWHPLGLLFTAMAIALPLTLMAGAMQSHDSIREAVRNHILAQSSNYPTRPEVSVGRLDSRLRLEQCSKPLETFSPPGKANSTRSTVCVRCNGQTPWSLYVPATVSIMLPIVVAATDLSRGALLTENDLTLKEHDITTLHRGYLEEIAGAIGKKLKRNLPRGQVLAPHQIATPLAVKRGNRVTIIAGTPGAFEIRTQGQALDNGAAGDRIKVRNISSKRVVEATIRSPGIVEVAL